MNAQQLSEYVAIAIEVVQRVPPTYWRNGAAVVVSCLLLRRLVTFVSMPAALRGFPLLRGKREVRLALEERLYEIRADEEVAYQYWEERRRSVTRRMNDMLDLARETSRARQQLDLDDQVEAAIIEYIDTLALDFVRGSSDEEEERGAVA